MPIMREWGYMVTCTTINNPSRIIFGIEVTCHIATELVFTNWSPYLIVFLFFEFRKVPICILCLDGFGQLYVCITLTVSAIQVFPFVVYRLPILCVLYASLHMHGVNSVVMSINKLSLFFFLEQGWVNFSDIGKWLHQKNLSMMEEYLSFNPMRNLRICFCSSISSFCLEPAQLHVDRLLYSILTHPKRT
jgi:hypothetical protein